ncbi:unnamed protein product [Leptosia nina]|uniref:Uncharacterized protein n=1 Tax=Leptosia nina TaxID=320188 RepID=A0AAV1JGH5_9NEOP
MIVRTTVENLTGITIYLGNMVELNGENLGKAHQELHIKVQELVENETKLEDINDNENSYIDKILKIRVASKLKNIYYILEVMKCGDSLCISHALMCEWIYDDAFSNIINPDYLHHDVFPLMSLKMKNKMLNKIAANVRNETRAAAFFTYCKSLRIEPVAQKFLYFTSDSFKSNLIENKYQLNNIDSNLKYLIGNSIDLAVLFISQIEFDTAKEDYLMQLAYLYTVDAEKYLNLFEKNIKTNRGKRFGGRMSKSILTNHKTRVLNLPSLYIHKLNKYMLVRHSTSEDAKKYIASLLPTDLEKFWKNDFYGAYSYIFNMIPKSEAFKFFKNSFKALYGDKPFEKTCEFYHFRYYELFCEEDKEKWALQQIEDSAELLGTNKDYIWFKFVNFDQALVAIKKYILVTADEDDRNEMAMVLIKSCKNQKDLQKLFEYYYERFVNESGHHKENFIDQVVENHNIFQFDEQCWTAFNKILYSLQVYTPGFFGKNKYRTFCIIYNIIHKNEMHTALTHFMDSEIMPLRWIQRHSKNLTKEQVDDIYQYLFDYYVKQFHATEGKKSKELKEKRIDSASRLLHLLENFNKKIDDIPEVILNFVEENIKNFKHMDLLKDKRVTEASLMRLLKKDKNLVITKLPEVMIDSNYDQIKLTTLLKKVKVYFPNDIAIEILKFFDEHIKKSKENDWNMRTAVYAVFILGNEVYKKQLLAKYSPTEPKIDHSKIDRNLLGIQEAICRFACYSFPPVPLNAIMPYITGDYVHFCLPMFNMYLSNLPLPLSIKFITAILEAPISIQKHGIRMAFKAFTTENLKLLITDVWRKTKNVSLRQVMYKALVTKIDQSNEITQDELFDTLNMFTSTLHTDDQDGVFSLITSKQIPDRFRGKLLETTWMSVKNLSHKKSKNILIKIRIVRKIEQYIKLVDRAFCKKEIVQLHIDNMLVKKQIQDSFTVYEDDLFKEMWSLTSMFLISCKDESDLNESLTLIDVVYKETFDQWSYVSKDNIYVVMRFCFDFINNIKEKSFEESQMDNVYIIPILEHITKLLEEFPLAHKIYVPFFKVKFYTNIRKIMEKTLTDAEHTSKFVVNSLVKLIEDLKTKDKLAESLLDTLSDIVSNILRDMALLLKQNADILIAYVCIDLLENSFFNILLSIATMPLDPYYSETDITLFRELQTRFIKKINNINNFDIQSYYFNKFVANDFRKRVES